MHNSMLFRKKKIQTFCHENLRLDHFWFKAFQIFIRLAPRDVLKKLVKKYL